MSPMSARLLDEVATEATRAHAAAVLQLTMIAHLTSQRDARLERERDDASRILAALRAARIRSFFLGRSEQPFEGTA